MAKKAAKKKVAKKIGNGARRPWTKEDVKAFKAHSKGKTPVAKIAKETGRTEGAIRQKARLLDIPIGHRR